MACCGRTFNEGRGPRMRNHVAAIALLAMQGDESCVIEARIEGSRVTLPSTLPPGCAYYCGPGVEMGGATFDQAGDSDGDARRAVDLVGDPLCG